MPITSIPAPVAEMPLPLVQLELLKSTVNVWLVGLDGANLPEAPAPGKLPSSTWRVTEPAPLSSTVP